MSEPGTEITWLVERWGQGDESALEPLVELVYDDLRQIARRHLRTLAGGQTLGTTALVNELYLKLAGVQESTWGGRAQFFAFCSKAMRHILVDHARRSQATKRGGDRVQVSLSRAAHEVEPESSDLVALDEALDFLATKSERMARIVECRFFGGLSVAETAETLGTSIRTVEREWARARAYLHTLLAPGQLGLESG
jgi:RNA polymerase sigma factor (TIGR02999 family)